MGKYNAGDLWNRIDDAISAESAGEEGLARHPRATSRTNRLHLARVLVANAKRAQETSREARAAVTAERRKVARRQAPRLKALKLARLGCACEACGTAMPVPSMLHLHHVVPVARGGETADENCALLCPNCHAKAHWLDRHLTEEERPSSVATLLVRLAA